MRTGPDPGDQTGRLVGTSSRPDDHPDAHPDEHWSKRGEATRDRGVEGQGRHHRRLPRPRPIHGQAQCGPRARPPLGGEAGAQGDHQPAGPPPRDRRRRPLPAGLHRPREQEARGGRAQGRAQGRERALPRDRRGPRGGGHLVAPARGAQAQGAGQADGVPRDHPRSDRRGHRQLARPRHEAGGGPGGPAHPRPPRGLRGVERRLPSHRTRHVGGARAERRHPSRRRPRAGAHGVPLRFVLGPRGHLPPAGRHRRRRWSGLPGHPGRARRPPPRARSRLRRRHRRAQGRRAGRAPRRGRRPRPRRPPRRRALHRRVGRHEAVHGAPEGAVHHVDAAAGGGPQARLQRRPHDEHRPGALRAGPHHVHAYRQHLAVGAGGARGRAPRSPSSTATPISRRSRASTAAR